VPLASILAASYGWSAVFIVAVTLNVLAALSALFIIKPIRRAFIEKTHDAAPVGGAAKVRAA
jgi:OFA family oxalate/formate antiporter-like MFS transporter